jgi:hypothetical protein
MRGQRVELTLPEHAVPVQPDRRISHGITNETTEVHATLPAAGDQPGALEHPQVLRDRG